MLLVVMLYLRWWKTKLDEKNDKGIVLNISYSSQSVISNIGAVPAIPKSKIMEKT